MKFAVMVYTSGNGRRESWPVLFHFRNDDAVEMLNY